MNQVIIYGKVESIDKIKKEFYVLVPRSYSSYDGRFIEDKIKCSHFNNINKNMTSYICIEDTILIKGRLEENNNQWCIMVESYQVLKRKI